MKKVFIYVFVVTALFLQGFEGLLKAEINDLIEHYNGLRVAEKTYLHFDRDLYAQGDTAWFKAYVVDEVKHQLSANSKTLYVHLINEKGIDVESLKFPIINGTVHGYIPFDKNEEEGIYEVVAFTSWMKNFDTEYSFKRRIYLEKKKESELFLNVMFDNEKYYVGDSVHIDLSVIDKTGSLYTNRLNYRLKIDDEVVMEQRKRLNSEGKLGISFLLPEGSSELSTYLELVVNARSDDEQVNKYLIPVKDNKLNVQFFPEGGYLIKNLRSNMAFKVTNNKGEPVEVEADLLVDGKGVLKKVKTDFNGMGKFSLLPVAHNSFSLKINSPQSYSATYKLPTPLKEGYIINYISQTDSQLIIRVGHNYTENKPMSLSLNMRGRTYYTIQSVIGNYANVRIPVVDCPDGVAVLTLFDEKNKPCAERLVFINRNRLLNIEVSQKYEYFLNRQEVVLDLTVTDENGQPMPANLSLAVVDSINSHSSKICSANILSELMLRPEIRGKIKNPNAYFNKNNPNATEHLDLLLLTQGWRKYNWLEKKEVVLQNFEQIGGKVLRGKKPSPNASIILFINNGSGVFNFNTNDKGVFNISPAYEDRDIPSFLFLAQSNKGSNNVKINIFEEDKTYESSVLSYNDSQLLALKDFHNPIGFFKNNKDSIIINAGNTTRVLSEVTVIGKRKEEDAISSSYETTSARHRKGSDLIAGGGFIDLLRQVTFISEHSLVTGNVLLRPLRGGNNFNIGGLTEDDAFGMNDERGTLFVVDGIEVGRIVNDLDYLTPENIKYIMVVPPDDAFFQYGTRGLYGVVVVETKGGVVAQQTGDAANKAVVKPFAPYRTFYAPIYDTDFKRMDIMPDIRTTMDWQPEIQVDASGKASVSFYTSDNKGIMNIIVQGVGNYGYLGYQKQSFEVK